METIIYECFSLKYGTHNHLTYPITKPLQPRLYVRLQTTVPFLPCLSRAVGYKSEVITETMTRGCIPSSINVDTNISLTFPSRMSLI